MQYDVSIEVFALIMLVMFTIFIKIANPLNAPQNKAFIRLSLCVIISCIADIVSCLIINARVQGYNIPIWVMYPVNMVFFITIMLDGFCYCTYLYTLIGYEDFLKTQLSKVILIPVILFSLVTLTTPWTHLLFYFDENGKYTFGTAHFLAVVVMLIYVVVGVMFLIIYKNKISKMQLYSTLIFTLAAAVGMFVQNIFMPNKCIGMPTAAMAIILIYFSLQTPDSYVLMHTMDELKKAKKQAEDATKAKETFFANMSHEIRTPINSVLGMNEMILHKSTDPDIIKYAETARKSGASLLALVNNVLDYTKLTTGELRLIDEPYDTRKMFENVISEAMELAKGKNVKFETDISPELPKVMVGDQIRIRQILYNLVSNAFKFTNEGSVVITASCKKTGSSLVKLKISVTDTGCGIKKEDIKRIFGSFVRLNTGENYSLEGAGLGLSVTSELLEMMDGDIDVESTFGKGSKFTVEFLQGVENAEQMGEITVSETVDTDAASEKDFYAPDVSVLAADDCEVNLFIISELLKQFGIRTDIAISGEKCFEMAAQKLYDLIILDHMMPGIDGIETLHMIKETSGCASIDTPVVVLTANAVVGAREQYIKEGFDGYMSKPITFKALSEVLNKFIPESVAAVKTVSEDINNDEDIFSHVHLSHVNVLRGISRCGGREKYMRKLKDFAGRAVEYAEKLEKAVDNKDTDAYAEMAGKVKKETLEIGAENLSDMAKLQEMFALVGKYEDVITLHRDFINTLTQVTAESEKIIIGSEH